MITEIKRLKNRKEVLAIFDKAFRTRTADEWEEVLKVHDLLFEKIQKTEALPGDPQVIANEYIVDFDHPTSGKIKMLNYPAGLSETPGGPKSAAPELGQHTEEILTNVGGYTGEEIVQFKDAGII